MKTNQALNPIEWHTYFTKAKLITMALHLSLIICITISDQYKCDLKTDQPDLHIFNSVLFIKE